MEEVQDIFSKMLPGKQDQFHFTCRQGKTIMRSLPVNRSRQRTKTQLQGIIHRTAVCRFEERMFPEKLKWLCDILALTRH